ncbi:MAG: glycosyltransferase family 4 protein [Myxococcaceae bacterium]
MERFLVVTGDFVDTGGMDVANFAFARHLAKRGDEVHLVAHRVAKELSRFGNVTVHRVPRPASSHLLGSPLLDAAGRFRSLRLDKPRRVVVNGGNCGSGDVNWVHYLHSAFEPAGSTVPLVRAKQKLVRPWLLQNERSALRRAKVIIANSEKTRSDILQHLDVPAERVHTVYYGTDPALFAPVDEDGKRAARAALGWKTRNPVAVFIGALGDRRKGFDVLFDAWARLCRADWDTDLVVVGQGAELSVWRAKAAVAGLQQRIQFLGFRTDVARILQASDLLISPTRYEAYGLGVHEALCCGLPAVVSESAGVAERFSPGLKPLLLSHPDDALELVRLLMQWRDQRAHCAQEARKLSAQLRERTWDDMAREILSLL